MKLTQAKFIKMSLIWRLEKKHYIMLRKMSGYTSQTRFCVVIIDNKKITDTNFDY